MDLIDLDKKYMTIMGISDVTGNHSHSCVALLHEGALKFALSQERITRVKNDSRFPYEAIQALLDYGGLQISDIDIFACGYPPAKYYSGLLGQSLLDLPRSLLRVLARNPIKFMTYLGPNIKKGLFDPKFTNGLMKLGVASEKIQFIDHHLAHVSAAFRNSTLDQALGLSYGGFAPLQDGTNVAGAVFTCGPEGIERVQIIPYSATACFVSGVAVALGFTYMQQEGKIMALAAMGNPEKCYEELRRIATVFENGAWRTYKRWIDYIMSPRRDMFLQTKSGREIVKLVEKYSKADVAAAAQKIIEENLVAFVTHLHQIFSFNNLVLAGGIFNNILLNTKLQQLPFVKKIFVHPFPGDGSTTLGAAYEAYARKTGQQFKVPMRDMGFGMNFSERSIEVDLRRSSSSISFNRLKGDVAEIAAYLLANGQIVGFFQGREEYGPRALGHRCILADPRRVTLRLKLTMQLKQREKFIPLAVSCLEEQAPAYFENYVSSPFMSFVYRAEADTANQIPAALHVDRTVRVQGVHKNDNPPFRRLLERFYQRTGIPLVLNTSLNRHGEPIVHTPTEAIELLLQGSMDTLLIENFMARRHGN